MNKKVLYILILLQSAFVYGYAPMNLYRPYDINWRMEDRYLGKKFKYKMGTNIEYGSTDDSRNWDSEKVNLLDMYQDSQSSIAMLLNPVIGSDIEKLAQDISPATDDGIRGHFKLEGARYKEFSATVYLQRLYEFESITGKFYLTGYLPLRDMRISNVCWVDQTKNVTNADLSVKDKLTDDIFGIASRLGNLDLGNWSEAGVSDLVFTVAWANDFPQEAKRNLDNVRLTGKVGITLPTGSKKNEDKVFSLPLGNDGAFGIPCSGAMDLYFKKGIKFGIELEFLTLLDNTKVRRVKTDNNQTDFLLLNKANVRKSFSPTWKFNLYLQARHFYKGFSIMSVFQNAKHGNDKLFSKNNAFDTQIINSMQSLKDWSYHNLILQLNYDFLKDSKDSVIKPQLSLFYKLAFAGRRTIQVDTFGGQLAFNF